MKMQQNIIDELNKSLRNESPEVIIETALQYAEKPIVTTNFRPYEGAILHAVSKVKSEIPVIWCDTGYNTSSTYKHANELIKKLALNVQLYVPKQTVAYRDVVIGIPSIDDENHKLFTEQVKLEPFKRAFQEWQPDAWFTNLRKGQTQHRDNLDILSLSGDGVLKIAPFYYHSDEALDAYLEKHQIPNEFNYFDPTKVLENRECGLHI